MPVSVENLEVFIKRATGALVGNNYATLKCETVRVGNSIKLSASVLSNKTADGMVELFNQKTDNERYYKPKGFGEFIVHEIMTQKSLECKCVYDDQFQQGDSEVFYVILYLPDYVELIPIESVCKYLEKVYEDVEYLEGAKINQYYRGQISHWPIIPSLFRELKWIENEAVLNEQIISDRPADFSDCQTHLEKLVRLKHYNQPSRLLDLTSNPLIGLYFACEYSQSHEGEFSVVHCCFVDREKEKYASLSDTADMLTALTRSVFRCAKLPEKKGVCPNYRVLITQDKKKMECLEECDYTREIEHQLVKEVGEWKGGIKLGKLDTCILVNPPKNNHRIVQQQGLFLYCGRNQDHPLEPPESLESFFKLLNGKRRIFVVPPSIVEDLQFQLNVLGINQHYVYGDLDQHILFEKERMK